MQLRNHERGQLREAAAPVIYLPQIQNCKSCLPYQSIQPEVLCSLL